MNSRPLSFALFAGAAYLLCMSVAHYVGFKQPMLFVYYDTPFYAYQDKIIAFTLISYVVVFFLAARQRALVPAALTVLGVTVLGLSSINLSDDLLTQLKDGQTTLPYWIQTGVFAGYLGVMLWLYLRDAKSASPSN